MGKITAIICTKNDEEHIRKSLESIKDVVEEIVIVDGHSTDDTIEICEKYTSKIYRRKPKGYAEADLPFAIDQATGDWILFISAHERIPKTLRKNLQKLVKTEDFSGYKILRVLYRGGKWLKHMKRGYSLKLFKKKDVQVTNKIHDIQNVDGKVKVLPDKFFIPDFAPPSLQDIPHQMEFAKIEAQQYPYSWRKPWSIPLPWETIEKARTLFQILGAIAAFIKHFIIKGGFLEGYEGFSRSMLFAFTVFMVNHYRKKVEPTRPLSSQPTYKDPNYEIVK